MKILFLIKGDKNMKNILTSAITATLLTGLAFSTMSASNSQLVFDGIKGNHDKNDTIWIDKQYGQEFNLTLIPVANYKGASFDMQFTNGGIDINKKQILCVGTSKVGDLQDPGDSDENGISKNPRYSFADDDTMNELLKKDANITFKTATDCNSTHKLEVIPSADKPCQKVTAKIIKGTSTQSNDIKSIVTEDRKEAVFGNTKRAVRISCSVPICYVENKVKFNNLITPPGINLSLNKEVNTSDQQVGDKANCPVDGCTQIAQTEVTGTTSTCKTYIQVASIAPKDEVNITKIKISTGFIYSNGVKTSNNYPNPTINVSDISNGLGNVDNNATITLTFTANNKKPISLGTLIGTLSFEENGEELSESGAIKNHPLTEIRSGAKTRFTVPYMYKASKSNFVKISTLIGGSDVKLSAEITDNKGNECSVNLKPIPGNGGSTYVFVDGREDEDRGYQPLIPKGECSDLDGNQYSVVFTTSSSVNVVSYMKTKVGERTVIPF
jgi:hypothetical protein